MIQARSIGRRAAQVLDQAPQGGRVLACFTRAWDLLIGTSQVCALGWAGVPDGPFNILLDDAPGAALPAGARWVIAGTRMRFAAGYNGRMLEIETGAASVWQPQPNWALLAANYAKILAGLRLVAGVLAGAGHAGGACNPGGALGLTQGLSGVREGAAPLAGWRTSSRQALASSVTALCGLGPGLTPAGDDWLAGWLLALRLCEATDAKWAAQVDAARHAVRQAAVTRTTTLSRAFLDCAADGETDADWQDLLQALAAGAPQPIQTAARRILAHGATSGAAMLAGFLVGLGVEREITPCY